MISSLDPPPSSKDAQAKTGWPTFRLAEIM
jgi:hypothetical protein